MQMPDGVLYYSLRQLFAGYGCALCGKQETFVVVDLEGPLTEEEAKYETTRRLISHVTMFHDDVPNPGNLVVQVLDIDEIQDTATTN